ncbi:MAG: hypothetical protein Q9P01_06130 [Anaerolineae bacterium]|nr:hypothetical protein [Anaerolineae bacterium]
MFNLVEKRRWYFLISAMLIIPGLLIMGYSWTTTGAPFRLSIDFAGGSIYDLAFEGDVVSESQLREVFAANGDDNVIIQQLGQSLQRWLISDIAIEVDNREEVASLVADAVASTPFADVVSVEERDNMFIIRVDDADIEESTIRDVLAEFIMDETTIEQVTVTVGQCAVLSKMKRL